MCKVVVHGEVLVVQGLTKVKGFDGDRGVTVTVAVVKEN